jgi:hypothetical protein
MIRIVEDTVNVTAAGQRRRIASHTAGSGGTAAIYTVSGNWAVTPSAGAKFVIEGSNEILCWTSGSANTFTYAQDTYGSAQTGDTWSTATYGARGSAVAAGCMAVRSHGLVPDQAKLARHSNIFAFRGGTALDILDVAGGANGLWTNGAPFKNSGTNFTSGSAIACAPATQEGRYAFIIAGVASPCNMYRLDLVNRVLEPYVGPRWTQGTMAVGARMASTVFVDGTTKISFVILLASSQAVLLQLMVIR